MARPERLRLLERMVQDAERRLDGQVATARHADSTAGHLIGVGVAMLGFGVSMGVYLSQQALAGPLLLASLGISLAQNVGGILWLVKSMAGFRSHRELFAAPETGWLEERMADEHWGMESHLSSLISSYATYSKQNHRTTLWSARARQRGMITLATAAICYIASMFFIAGAPIHG